jgi:hypothetical protein
MNVVQFEVDAANYELRLAQVRAEYQLPDKWLERPDHVAIKCADTASYLSTVESFRPLVDEASYGKVELGGRRLASAEFLVPIQLCGVEFNMIEIMEPRPNADPIKESFVEHTEFTVDDLLTVYNGLTQRIAPTDDAAKVVDDRGSHHPGIVLEFGDGLEVKFNKTSLAGMVIDEKRRKIWQRIK